ncbi:MAG: excinuclease ABC subunit UvrC [Clostridia bacterium]|nr:excinuclease ABC subunit UvrC [Clostridia bacterium]
MTELNPKLPELRAKSMALPLQPGVYLMYDKSNKIIYVGKAKALKNRVSQYFGSDKNHQEKVKQMVLHVHHFEYIVTDSEFEALVLENSLIKHHQPKYNILLKDDKGYSYIRVSAGRWPKISEAKQIADDGAKYIGPYMSSWTIKQTIDEAQKIFKLPSCNKKFPQDFGKSRPCLNYYINQCSAPCRGKTNEKEYNEAVQEALDFIKGGSTEAIRSLTDKMEEAAENLEFETAARIRDRIQAIKAMRDKQKVVESRVRDQDVIAVSFGNTKCVVAVLKFQDGRLYDRENFSFTEIENIEELRAEFIRQYYSDRDRVPPQVTIDGECDDRELLEAWLTEKAKRKVSIHIPQKGDQLKLVEMCRANAAEKLAEGTERSGRELSALDELARLLGLSAPPEYIESYDISNLAGEDNVAGMVVFRNGRPYKAGYRRFRIKTVTGQDDYGSMREVITRRFEEYYKHKELGDDDYFGTLPNLILLDGGKGHVGAILPVLESMNINVPCFGMVKDDSHRTRAIAVTGGEISITSTRQAFTLCSQLQDEVHRWAIGYHRTTRKKRTISSTLTQISGMGEARATALMKHFRTVKAISEADLTELENCAKMNHPSAVNVWNYFHPDDMITD